MYRIIILLLLILFGCLTFLLYEPLELDIKVCTTDWGGDCDNLQIVHGQSLYVHMQSNKPATVTITSLETLEVDLDGFRMIELPFEMLGDSVMVNDQLFGFEVYEDVTPEYYFDWDMEADE